ncbi:DUF177 domain-containing protein [Asticcacaulis sp. AC402]|uniref:YceD family protein n=1 Tax=Asticcacaulis sp. AC402 TaxID=1282361 RepID=UPI0003C3F9F8|nr:DUF177 domain-containing protein [Asticcacaulis sp. AC402]ESQ75378.1 hypothetical protein ABAC402_09750 [Asticcacaulis sp. AC402]
MDTHEDKGLWEHKVRFDTALRGLKLELTADTERRAVIAAGFGMVSLDALTAHIETRPGAGTVPIVRIRLRLEGAVTQECGISLEPFSHPLFGDLEIDCIEKARVTDQVAEIGEHELTLNDLDEPDVIANGQIDLGQYVIEALGDAYDPFARKPGVVFDEPAAEREPSPFAVLANLKRDE